MSWYNTKFSRIAYKEMYGHQLTELAFSRILGEKGLQYLILKYNKKNYPRSPKYGT